MKCKVSLYQQKYKKRKRRRTRIVLVSVFSVLILLVTYYFCVVNPVVLEVTKQSVYSLSTSAISDAVFDVMDEENLSYDQLVKVEKDDVGNITMLSLQTVKLNLVARRFYQVAQTYLDEMGKMGVGVALGTFTGIPFLVGFGPKINLRLTPIGAMTSTFESNFVSAGINQTKHTLYVRLYASVSLLMPAYSSTIDSVTEVIIAENVLLGKVPEVYFGNGSLLSFTPQNN